MILYIWLEENEAKQKSEPKNILNTKKKRVANEMSWQDYVDNQLMASQCVTKACIAGHDGNIWASSKGFEVSYTVNSIHLKFNSIIYKRM